jgi:hypothetical protein
MSIEEEKQVSYTGNGTAGRENMTLPTGFLFQMPKAEKQEPVAQPKREWVGLTDDEYQAILKEHDGAGLLAFYNLIEAKLREKNT